LPGEKYEPKKCLGRAYGYYPNLLSSTGLFNPLVIAGKIPTISTKD